MKEYNQNLIAPNACTIVAILTTLSNQFGKELSTKELKECYEFTWRTFGRGWLPIAAVKSVLSWRNTKYNTRIVWKRIQFGWREFLDAISKWFVYVSFRYSEDYIKDFMTDWVIDNVPTDKQKGWHSVTMTRLLTVIDNYKWREHNIYRIKDLEIAKKIFRWDCYIFKV